MVQAHGIAADGNAERAISALGSRDPSSSRRQLKPLSAAGEEPIDPLDHRKLALALGRARGGVRSHQRCVVTDHVDRVLEPLSGAVDAQAQTAMATAAINKPRATIGIPQCYRDPPTPLYLSCAF